MTAKHSASEIPIETVAQNYSFYLKGAVAAVEATREVILECRLTDVFVNDMVTRATRVYQKFPIQSAAKFAAAAEETIYKEVIYAIDWMAAQLQENVRILNRDPLDTEYVFKFSAPCTWEPGVDYAARGVRDALEELYEEMASLLNDVTGADDEEAPEILKKDGFLSEGIIGDLKDDREIDVSKARVPERWHSDLYAGDAEDGASGSGRVFANNEDIEFGDEGLEDNKKTDLFKVDVHDALRAELRHVDKVDDVDSDEPQAEMPPPRSAFANTIDAYYDGVLYDAGCYVCEHATELILDLATLSDPAVVMQEFRCWQELCKAGKEEKPYQAARKTPYSKRLAPNPL